MFEKFLTLRALKGGSGGSGGSGESGSGGSGGDDNFPIGDGDTHIWITLSEGRTSPRLGVGVNGTVTVDWGDGSEPDTLTGTSITAQKSTPTHNYEKAGNYIITLSGDGQIGISGTSAGSLLLSADESAGNNVSYCYRNAIKKIECGYNVVSVGSYAFEQCAAVQSILISDSVKSFGGTAFSRCSSLASVNIPDGVQSIGTYVFNSCFSLARVIFPSSVTNIASLAFYVCYSVALYDFSKHTAVPTIANAGVFDPMAADCEIRVPAALYDEWIAATNWTTLASKIVAV
ncbi:MAG: leucine-rich repeat domain-containing protein [Oscillospiraceae bacterium]|nr:leucine-rich repeat domain-containing protein [Oscillospiraceae bacterium]